jgi:hypothetical protein
LRGEGFDSSSNYLVEVDAADAVGVGNRQQQMQHMWIDMEWLAIGVGMAGNEQGSVTGCCVQQMLPTPDGASMVRRHESLNGKDGER